MGRIGSPADQVLISDVRLYESPLLVERPSSVQAVAASRLSHSRSSSAIGPGSVNFGGCSLRAEKDFPVTPSSSGALATHSGVSAPLAGETANSRAITL